MEIFISKIKLAMICHKKIKKNRKKNKSEIKIFLNNFLKLDIQKK